MRLLPQKTQIQSSRPEEDGNLTYSKTETKNTAEPENHELNCENKPEKKQDKR